MTLPLRCCECGEIAHIVADENVSPFLIKVLGVLGSDATLCDQCLLIENGELIK